MGPDRCHAPHGGLGHGELSYPADLRQEAVVTFSIRLFPPTCPPALALVLELRDSCRAIYALAAFCDDLAPLSAADRLRRRALRPRRQGGAPRRRDAVVRG